MIAIDDLLAQCASSLLLSTLYILLQSEDKAAAYIPCQLVLIITVFLSLFVYAFAGISSLCCR